MKKSRFFQVQIMNILKEACNGSPVAELCRTHGISDPTYYSWRSKYGGMNSSTMSELEALQEENPTSEKDVRRSSTAK